MNSSSMQFFLYFLFIFNFTYRCISWRPIVAFLMELELHELEFHAIFFFSLINPYSRDISLISLENGTKH